MGLEKSIASGKEHRKFYRRGKEVDVQCRNGGKCPFCQSNRRHKVLRKMEAAKDKEKYEDNSDD